jgi:hypothetical protein
MKPGRVDANRASGSEVFAAPPITAKILSLIGTNRKPPDPGVGFTTDRNSGPMASGDRYHKAGRTNGIPNLSGHLQPRWGGMAQRLFVLQGSVCLS